MKNPPRPQHLQIPLTSSRAPGPDHKSSPSRRQNLTRTHHSTTHRAPRSMYVQPWRSDTDAATRVENAQRRALGRFRRYPLIDDALMCAAVAGHTREIRDGCDRWRCWIFSVTRAFRILSSGVAQVIWGAWSVLENGLSYGRAVEDIYLCSKPGHVTHCHSVSAHRYRMGRDTVETFQHTSNSTGSKRLGLLPIFRGRHA